MQYFSMGKFGRKTLNTSVIAQEIFVRCFADGEYNGHTFLLFKKYPSLKSKGIVEYML